MEAIKNEQILSLVSKAHQPALQKAIEFNENPTQQTAEAVAQVMNELFEIKHNRRTSAPACRGDRHGQLRHRSASFHGHGLAREFQGEF